MTIFMLVLVAVLIVASAWLLWEWLFGEVGPDRPNRFQ